MSKTETEEIYFNVIVQRYLLSSRTHIVMHLTVPFAPFIINYERRWKQEATTLKVTSMEIFQFIQLQNLEGRQSSFLVQYKFLFSNKVLQVIEKFVCHCFIFPKIQLFPFALKFVY